MDVSLDLYYIYYYICKFESITKAANYLYISQPAVSRHLKNLENYIGKTLVKRGNKNLTLTNEGQLLFNEIKDPIENLNLIGNRIKNANENYEIKIRIIAGHYTIKNLLLKEISKFNIKHSNVKFELCTFPYQEAIQKLREESADLIFFSMKEIKEKYNDIVYKKCYELHDIFVANPKFYNNIPECINILDLNNYPVISKKSGTVTRDVINNFFHSEGLKFIPKYEVSNNWIIEEYIKLGMGIGTIAKEFSIEELKKRELVEIKTSPQLPKREIGYAIRKNSSSFSLLNEFVQDLVRDFPNID